jgi:Cu/Ag efflux protein CusF
MGRIYQLLAVASLCMGLAAIGFAQTAPAKKAYTFHGKVEAVDNGSKSLKVNGEEVKGWMAAMTMDYKVDDPAVLKKVRPGDQIMATVYDGDLVLHKVQVMPQQGGDSKTKK